MATNRLKNSSLNFASGIVGRALTILLNFVVRTIFIRCLNEAYLSVNGLYSNILTVLSLAELGFGSAMVYRMYAPMAEKDYCKLAQLLQLYRRIYRIVGCVILCAGLCVIPFMDYIIKDKPDVSYLTLYYVIFLLNTVSSYWFASYKNSVLIADQKEYIKTNTTTATTVVVSVIQIVFLLVFKEYLIYLLLQVGSNIFINLFIAAFVNRKYPEINKMKGASLSKEEKRLIADDTKALMLSRFGHVILNGTDNILVSSIVGVLWVGRLSNYTLICDSVTSVLTQITSALTGSLGNFFATEDKKAGYSLFKRVEFLNYWLYAFSFIALITLLDPFIQIWVGANFRLGLAVSFAMALNFFVAGYMNTLWTFRSTLGIFNAGKYRPLIVAGLNIVLSIIMGKIMGVFGILFATFLSRAAVNLWYDPIIIHKYGFNTTAKPFFWAYLKRIALMIVITLLMLGARHIIIADNTNIVRFTAMAVVVLIVPNFIFWMVYRKKEEYLYFQNILKDRVLRPIRQKIRGNGR